MPKIIFLLLSHNALRTYDVRSHRFLLSPNRSCKNVLRAFSHTKAWPAEFAAIPQLRCLALSRISIRRGRHESVMHLVMSSAEWLLSPFFLGRRDHHLRRIRRKTTLLQTR